MDEQRLLPPWDMECPSRGSTCPSYEKSLLHYLRVSVDSRGESFGFELCPRCLEECYRYTRENRQGEWPEFKEVLDAFYGTSFLSDDGLESLRVRYEIASARERSYGLEHTLFTQKDLFRELEEYLKTELVAEHRAEMEGHLMVCAMRSTTAMKNALRYSTNVRKGGLHDALETAILKKGLCGPVPAVEFAVSTKSDHWIPVEELLLGSRPTKEVCQALIRYTAVCVGGRWDPAEQYILSIPEEPRKRNAIVWYASKVVRGWWKEAEKELEGSPRHLYGYAKKVMNDRLPDDLHHTMERHRILGLVPEQREFVERYFKEYGV